MSQLEPNGYNVGDRLPVCNLTRAGSLKKSKNFSKLYLQSKNVFNTNNDNKIKGVRYGRRKAT